ncbi:hypothetical protein KW076_02040 [Micrococcus porci]|uniref:hypothetical protein n=1 Tax=Micrococcus porci TaxID=2856555 RepID=UPI001CCBBFA0|nr:hypothetical protein [Micrococcus porci]UBH24999.1 hypothetical protein KW076_02040 [Micrococcus porci]
MESTQPVPEPFVLTLGAVLAAAGLDPHDVLAIRHTYKESGLPSRAAATPESVLAYTREQHHVGKFPKEPARHWLIFMGRAGVVLASPPCTRTAGRTWLSARSGTGTTTLRRCRYWPPWRSAWWWSGPQTP